MTFQLDPQFEKDSAFILDLPLCQLRLNHNAAFPWVIMIPRVGDMVEIIDLDDAQQQLLLKEINLVSRTMKEIYSADKLNVANLGNVTAQLHVHVIARFKTDPAWPGPVWNSGQTMAYTESSLPAEVQKITYAIKSKV